MGHLFERSEFSVDRRGNHILKMVLKYPDPFIPSSKGYSLLNPGDEFFEACRNRKRVCVLKILRHDEIGNTEEIGIFVLNSGELGTLRTEMDDLNNFIVNLNLNKEFLNLKGIPKVDPYRRYYYEVRMGSYLLSNELSFLEFPIKLDVPNEYTAGKTGYQYHPYIYDTPQRKDYSLHGVMGVSKTTLYEECLNSSMVWIDAKRLQVLPKSPFKLNANFAKYGANDKCAVVLSAKIDQRLLYSCDHFELFVGNSTTGGYNTLGKHKLVDSNFYYVDTGSTKLACNKLKYKLVGRSMGYENIITVVSDLVDISQSNVFTKRIDDSTGTKYTRSQREKSKFGSDK